MNTLEITASTVDEAVSEASKKLGVDRADLDVTVLEETQGLFGKGKVRVRIEVKEKVGAASAVVEPVSQPVEEAPTEPEPEAEPAKAEKAAKPRERRPKAKEARPVEEGGEVEVVATQEDADNLKAILDEVLELGDLDAEIEVTEIHGRYVNMTLDGRDVSYLVGRRGEVINALQYLLNVISTRKMQNGVRVVLEGNDYRKKRQDVLTKLATQIAEEVAKRGEEAVLDALPAFERRVVHKALSEFPGVVTYSEGEEPNRRVVIAPGE
jgi:spoIIIJ-associated protein